MAIIRVKDKMYIKLDLTNSYINSKGIYIAYSIYKNLEEREFEKNFINHYNDFIIKAHTHYEKELSLNNDNVEEKDIILDKIKELSILRNILYNREEDLILNHIEEFKELGFNPIYLDTKIDIPTDIITFAGKYIGQKFNELTLYSLLKKQFKDFELIND